MSPSPFHPHHALCTASYAACVCVHGGLRDLRCRGTVGRALHFSAHWWSPPPRPRWPAPTAAVFGVAATAPHCYHSPPRSRSAPRPTWWAPLRCARQLSGPSRRWYMKGIYVNGRRGSYPLTRSAWPLTVPRPRSKLPAGSPSASSYSIPRSCCQHDVAAKPTATDTASMSAPQAQPSIRLHNRAAGDEGWG